MDFRPGPRQRSMVGLMTDLRDDKPMWGLGEVLKQAWPASLSMLNHTLMQFVDGLMVSWHSPTALAAQFVGGILVFLPTSFALGMLAVVNTYVSQNLGAGRPHRCGQYAWAGMAVAVAYSLLLAPVLIALAGPLFGQIDRLAAAVRDATGISLTPEQRAPQLVAMQTMYFRYLMAGMGVFLVSRVLNGFFFGIHKAWIVLCASLAVNLANVGINYVLIFGKLGFPAMGLEGAAIGTVASVGLLVLLLGAVFLCRRMHRRFATRRWRDAKLSECRDLLRVGWPAGVQFANDTANWGVFTAVLVGVFGPAHLTANTVAVRYISLSFMPAVGISIATTALVGRYIGLGRPDLARRRTHAAVWVAMIYMGLCAAAFVVFRYPMVRIFAGGAAPGTTAIPPERIVAIGVNLLLLAAAFQVFDALGIVFVGALRGAGDTLWPMVVTIMLSWLVIGGGGAAAVLLAPELTSLGPWLAASGYVVVLGLLMAWRFESGAWRRIDLLGRGRPAVPGAEPADAEDAVSRDAPPIH